MKLIYKNAVNIVLNEIAEFRESKFFDKEEDLAYVIYSNVSDFFIAIYKERKKENDNLLQKIVNFMEKLVFSSDDDLITLVMIEFDENLFIHLDNDQVEDIKLNYMSPRFAEKLELSRPFDR